MGRKERNVQWIVLSGSVQAAQQAEVAHLLADDTNGGDGGCCWHCRCHDRDGG